MSVHTYRVQWTPIDLSHLDDDENEVVEKYINAQSKKERRETKLAAEAMLVYTRFGHHEQIVAGRIFTLNWTGSVLMYGFKSKAMGYAPLPPRTDFRSEDEAFTTPNRSGSRFNTP